jgi:hypothetical protein
MRGLGWLTGLGLCLTAGGALADPLPDLTPARDFSGNYQMTSSNGAKNFAVEYNAAARTVRVTPPDGPGYFLYDFNARDAKMVMPQLQKYMDQPALSARAQALEPQDTGGSAAGSPSKVEVTSTGALTIAGYQCQNTKITDTSNGHWSQLCVTSDGVLLQVLSSDGNQITAQSISYAAVPLADVTVPGGYTPLVIPSMPPGMSLPGGMQLPGGMSLPGGTGLQGTP